MAYTISYDGSNSGSQVGQNLGHITNHFLQSGTSNHACLRDLRTSDPQHDKNRIQNTNGGLLKDSYCWVLGNEEFQQWQDNRSGCLLWIRGDPGKGKTMLLCGIIDELTGLLGDTANISFFFCQATDARINTATGVLRGLIYSLVEKQLSLLVHVQSHYDKAGKALFEDINAWSALSKIFMDLLGDPTLRSTYLIIDALDECTTGLPSLLGLITQVSSAYPQIKWIVSSRNWPEIKELLDTTQITLISLELNESSVSEAVSKFIQHKVQHLAKVKNYTDETRDTICHHLSSNSQGTFLWVALVCQDLGRSSRRHALKKLGAFPPGLNALYSRMFDHFRNSEDAEACKRILAVMSIVYRPLKLAELASLVELPDDLSDDSEALSEIIAICGSFLTVREDTIRFVHQSAKEFLLTEMLNGGLAKSLEAEHRKIFCRSLQAIFKILQRDIFHLKSPGFPIEKVVPPTPNPLAAAKYACVYWVDHLHHSRCQNENELSVDEIECVNGFLQKKYLHWLEALSILGSLSQGIAAMLKLDGLLQERSESAALLHRVQDASRFVRYHKLAIERCPLQVYISCLVFSPMLSITRICYQRQRPDWVLNEPLRDKYWGSCLQTLEGHSGGVHSIAWSEDGSRLASASWDNTVRIWDSATGQCTSTLQEHGDSINSITWSKDGSQLVLLTLPPSDKTVRIWNPTTGHYTSTPKEDGARVRLIDWSRDRGKYASVYSDNTIRIWDLATSQCVSHLKGHSEEVNAVAWSEDGGRLASASVDKTVRIWNPASGQCTSILEGHGGYVYSIAWSHDGSRLASASQDKTLRIWDPAISQCASTLERHSDLVNSIAWSEDGSRLASASRDKTIRIWNPVTGQCMSTLKGHGNSVRSITWSQDGSRLASTSWDMTIMIWDPVIGQCASTLEGHSGTVTSIAWSEDGGRLASASDDKTVRIWNPASGQCASTLKGHGDTVNLIAWSKDGNRLASASRDKTLRVWDPATSDCVLTLKGHYDEVKLIAWSQDGSRFASASWDEPIRIWGSATGQCTSTLQGHHDTVHSISWSQDGRRLASASQDETVMIWDPTTAQCESRFYISSPDFVQFDKVNLNHLHTSNGTIELDLTNTVTSNRQCLPLPELHGFALSDDHSWITYNGINLLWLPAEYRPAKSSLFSMSGTKLAVASSSGLVICLSLAEQSTIPRLKFTRDKWNNYRALSDPVR